MPASPVIAEITPPILRWARETTGLSLEEAAKKLRRAPEVVRRWEEGIDLPTVPVVERMAAIYKRPLAVFYLPRAPQEPAPPQDFRKLPGDQPRGLSVKTRLAMRRARWLQDVATYLRKAMSHPKPTIGHRREGERASELAARIRQDLAITIDEQRGWASPNAALRSWRTALERRGVLVVQLPFDLEDARGFSLVSSTAPMIVMNASDVVQARIFTMMHECCHLLLRESGVCEPGVGSDRELPRALATVERYCNRFAGDLLVPSPQLAAIAEGSSEDNLSSLAREWKVSRQVVWGQLYAAGLVSEAQFWARVEHLGAAQVRAKPKKFFAPKPAVRCLRQIGPGLTHLVLAAYHEQLITASEVSDYLNVQVRDLPKVESLAHEPTSG